jgi:arsenate reductase
MKKSVLFLSAKNGVQSPMAEALLRRIDSEYFEVVSAGVEAEPVHPLTIDAMKEIGINLEATSVVSFRDLADADFDFVITLSDSSTNDWPVFPSADVMHWHFDNPLAFDEAERQERAFRALRDQIVQRLNLFVLVQVRTKTITSEKNLRDRNSAVTSSV